MTFVLAHGFGERGWARALFQRWSTHQMAMGEVEMPAGANVGRLESYEGRLAR